MLFQSRQMNFLCNACSALVLFGDGTCGTRDARTIKKTNRGETEVPQHIILAMFCRQPLGFRHDVQQFFFLNEHHQRTWYGQILPELNRHTTRMKIRGSVVS